MSMLHAASNCMRECNHILAHYIWHIRYKTMKRFRCMRRFLLKRPSPQPSTTPTLLVLAASTVACAATSCCRQRSQPHCNGHCLYDHGGGSGGVAGSCANGDNAVDDNAGDGGTNDDDNGDDDDDDDTNGYANHDAAVGADDGPYDGDYDADDDYDDTDAGATTGGSAGGPCAASAASSSAKCHGGGGDGGCYCCYCCCCCRDGCGCGETRLDVRSAAAADGFVLITTANIERIVADDYAANGELIDYDDEDDDEDDDDDDDDDGNAHADYNCKEQRCRFDGVAGGDVAAAAADDDARANAEAADDCSSMVEMSALGLGYQILSNDSDGSTLFTNVTFCGRPRVVQPRHRSHDNAADGACCDRRCDGGGGSSASAATTVERAALNSGRCSSSAAELPAMSAAARRMRFKTLRSALALRPRSSSPTPSSPPLPPDSPSARSIKRPTAVPPPSPALARASSHYYQSNYLYSSFKVHQAHLCDCRMQEILNKRLCAFSQ